MSKLDAILNYVHIVAARSNGWGAVMLLFPADRAGFSVTVVPYQSRRLIVVTAARLKDAAHSLEYEARTFFSFSFVLPSLFS